MKRRTQKRLYIILTSLVAISMVFSLFLPGIF